MTDLHYRLAIDFGTSNTAAAVERADGRIHILRLSSNSDSMPSAVALYDGNLVVGEEAGRLAGLDPTAFEPSPKRRLGEPMVSLAGQVMDPVDLVAAVLARVLAVAVQRNDGRQPSSVILTHPEAWGRHLLGRLWDAALRAGLDPRTLKLASEPVSASWHYAANAQVSSGDRIAVVDFGGGTCDIAVLDYHGSTGDNRGFTVIKAGGLDPLGGRDFDDLLYQWVTDQLIKSDRQELVTMLEAPAGLAWRLTLRDQVQEAKHALSMVPRAPVPVTVGGERVICTVTRDEFDALLSPLLGRAAAMAADVLSLAEVSSPPQQLFLTGGSSLIPAVQREFQRLTGGRVGTLGDPKQITCVGALQAPADLAPLPRRPEKPRPDPPVPPPRKPREKVKGLIIVAAAFVVLALIGSAFLTMTLDSDGTAGQRGGASPSPMVSSPQPTPVPSSPQPSCGEGLSPGACQTLAILPGNWVDRSTCSPAAFAPAHYSLSCAANGADKITGSGTTVYLQRFEDAAAYQEAVSTLMATQGFAAAEVSNDVTKPPAQTTWHFEDSEGEEGALMLWQKDGITRLHWMLDKEQIWIEVATTGGDPANLYAWWAAPA